MSFFWNWFHFPVTNGNNSISRLHNSAPPLSPERPGIPLIA